MEEPPAPPVAAPPDASAATDTDAFRSPIARHAMLVGIVAYLVLGTVCWVIAFTV